MKNKGLIDTIKKLYGFYRQKYVIMSSEYTKTVSHYFTDRVIESHLNGWYALATFAGEKVTHFVSVDVDEGGKKAVRAVVDAFEQLGIPRDKIYVSLSGRKGYHVDMFFDPWIYNDKAKNLYDLMIWKTGLNPKKVEFRPTHNQAVKVPLGIHASTGNRCWYLDRDTLEPIESMEYIMQIEEIPASDVLVVIRDWNKKRWNELYAEMICNDTGRDQSIAHEIEFNEEYYEAHRIREVGTRHNVMIEIACDLRHYGANKYQIQKALRGFYYKQEGAYIETSEQEVLDDIAAIAHWAEESVPVYKQRQTATGEPRPVVFDRRGIEHILSAPTSAARKVAFLIWSYCKIFGASHISYNTIAETVGCSVATVKTAVTKLIEMRIINRKSGGCHYRNGMLVRESNTYFIPADKSGIVSDTCSFTDRISKESFQNIYYRTISALCADEYLSQVLTKPEMDDVRQAREGALCVTANQVAVS